MNRGFSIIEILIAMALMIIVVSGITAGSGGFGATLAGHQSTISDSEINSEALHKAQDIIEEAAAIARTNYSAVVSSTTVDGIYKKSLSIPVAYTTQCMETIAGIVSWEGTYGRILSIGATTTIVNIPEMFALGGDCDIASPTNWPSSSSYPMNDPIFSGSLASDVDVVKRSDGRFVLVTTQKNPSNDTLWMVDVTDLDLNPMPYSSFETDSDLWAVDSINNFAFAVGATTTAQKPLQVFDISDETDITPVAEIALPDANAGIGRSVYYRDHKIYVGTQYLAFGASGVNHELHIFDVTDPSDPEWQASIDVDRNVNDIVVRNGLAYLATGPGGDNTVLKIYDVDPLSGNYLSLVGSYPATSAQAGTALYLLDDYVYLGRERPSGSGTTESLFIVVDVSNPTAPVLADSSDLNINKGTAVEGIFVKGGTAFIVTGDQNSNNQTVTVGDGPFILYDVSNPTNISLIVPCQAVNWSEKPTGLDMVDNYAFVSNESNDALQVIYPAISCS